MSNMTYMKQKNLLARQVDQKRTSLDKYLFQKGTKWDVGRQVGQKQPKIEGRH